MADEPRTSRLAAAFLAALVAVMAVWSNARPDHPSAHSLQPGPHPSPSLARTPDQSAQPSSAPTPADRPALPEPADPQPIASSTPTSDSVTTSEPTARPQVLDAYAPQRGDVVFQSLPAHELVYAIEGATESPLSHCGLVDHAQDRWQIVEAIGPVSQTPLPQFIQRGRGGLFAAFRLRSHARKHIDDMLRFARQRLGKPYDTRYRLDDHAIYCSELVFKAYGEASGEMMGPLVRLGDLRWRPYADTIRRYEGGQPPLDRLMITPRDLASGAVLELVYDNGLLDSAPLTAPANP